MILKLDENNISSTLLTAKKLLSSGSLVAIPTETVYGLGANALDETAISKIYKTKGRPSDNPLIIHISSLKMLSDLYNDDIPFIDIYKPVIDKFWPGPLTILLPRPSKIPLIVTANHEFVAVRFPSHPICRQLIELCGFPIAMPSANKSGRPSPTTSEHVYADLGEEVLIIDGGPCESGVESTVLDCLSTPMVILRPGGVTFDDICILDGFEDLVVHGGSVECPTTPGMKYRHYSPDAEVVLFEPSCDMRMLISNQIQELSSMGKKVGILRSSDASYTDEFDVSEYFLGACDKQVAQELFNGLRILEAMGVEYILVEGVAETGTGLAVMNRLRKAASSVVSETKFY